MKLNAGARRAFLVPLVAILAACGSGSGGGGIAGGGGTGGGGGGSMLMPTIESIQAGVFDTQCIVCHIGAGAPGGLRLDDANAFALLVGVASVQQSGLLRVDPGNPDDSYLIRKLEGDSTITGQQMPIGAPALSQADIDVIRQWITNGAQGPAMPPPSAPIRVSSLSPLPGSTLSAPPTMIMAMFDRELSAATVDVNSFLVQRSGGDGNFNSGNEVTITADSIMVSGTNPMTAIFDMTSSAGVNDTYQVTLVGDGGTPVTDLDANALDGEFTGTFPSGDGTAGGNFVAEFTVDALQPTLQSIQDNIFTPSCMGCHSGAAAPAGLELSSVSVSFMELVNVPSIQMGTLDRVEPNDPDNSYLIRKLEGGPGIGGQQMPLGRTPLDQSVIDVIRQWITDGAPM